MLTSLASALDPAKTITQYAHRIWDGETGLAQPTVYSLLQSRDGYLWLGTQDSLVRFDGVTFRSIASEPASPLSRALVRAVAEDASGNIWAGTIGNGLVRVTPEGKATRLDGNSPVLGSNAFCVAPDAQDRPGHPDLWVCGNNGLLHINDGRTLALTSAADGLPTGSVHATCVDRSGTRWVAADGGLAVTGPSHFTNVSLPVSLGPNGVTALACSTSGDSVWAGTDRGLIEYRASSRQPLRTWTAADGLPDDMILTLTPGRDGVVWVGTTAGMSRFRNGHFSTFDTGQGLSHSLVLAFLEDREGNLWAGTKNGLDEFTDGAVTPFGYREGLAEESAGPVAEDRAGRVWVGTAHSGIQSFQGGRFHSLTTANGLLSDTVLSLAPDSDGDLWVGTARGLNRIHDSVVVGSFGLAQGLPGAIAAIAFDSTRTLWVGTDRGLFHKSGQSFVADPLPGSASPPDILGLFAGQQVRIFAATADPGLYLAHLGPEQDHLVRNSTEITRPVDAMFIDRDLHESWMGTVGGGLLRWKAGTVKRVRVKDGLYDNRIYGILRDGDRNLWMASSKGIFRVSQQDLDDFADGRQSYVSSVPFTSGQWRFECQSGVQPAAISTHDGLLWFATNHGLVRIDPHRSAGDHSSPPTHINSVIVDGRTLPIPLGASPAFHIRPLERNLEIRYAGLSFRTPEKVQFRYQLEGYDKSWIDAGTRREAFFTNLPPGNFRFRVLARSADGLWSQTPAVITLIVEPRLYQRVWFLPALALLLGGITALFYRLRIRRLQNNFQLVLAERGRIARELHDTLLQGISGVTMQLQALFLKMPPSRERSWLGDIINDASRTSGEARRSLLGLRSTNASSITLDQKIAVSARQAVKGRALQLHCALDPVPSGLPADTEYQLLRIVEEALSNAVTHAQATEIRVRLQCGGADLLIRISDNGRGFDPGAASPDGHYGVSGMRERALEIGAHLEIESAPGQGTQLTIAFHSQPEIVTPGAPSGIKMVRTSLD